jgi:serine/threonine-protein kinase
VTSELSAGATIGSYRLVERVGVGAIAEVWRAYQPSLDRDVAVKILASRAASRQDFVARFRREALAISRLDHPQILPVYDFGEQDGFLYLVTPLVGGGTLAERLGRPWPYAEALQVLEALASALDFAHERGVIHGDVRPSNVHMTEQGRVVLSDFGIARILEEASGLNSAEAMAGTPEYLSPEQAAGETAGPASDLYSVGIIAYELLAGRVPFEAETPLAVVLAQVREPPPPAHTFNSTLPEAVESVLARGLSKSPRDRFPSGAAFTSALAGALGTDPSAGPLPIGGQRMGGGQAGGVSPMDRTMVRPLPASPGLSGPRPASRVAATGPRPSVPRPAAGARRPPARSSYAGLLALAALAAGLFIAAVIGARLLAVGQPAGGAAQPAATVVPASTPTSSPPTPSKPTAAPAAEASPTGSVPAPTATPAGPASTASEAVPQADRAKVSGLGFSPGQEAATPYDQGESLIAIKGTCAGRTDGHCQQVFFFIGERYLGTDTLRPSTSIGEIAPAGPGRIRVTYANYGPSDPLCCPGLPPVTITYTWNGQRLSPDGTPPGH